MAGHDLFVTWLREGEGTRGVTIQRFLEDLDRFIEKVCCTAQCDVNFLERLLPFPFLVEGLKTAVMYFIGASLPCWPAGSPAVPLHILLYLHIFNTYSRILSTGPRKFGFAGTFTTRLARAGLPGSM